MPRDLSKDRAKRSASATPEPFGGLERLLVEGIATSGDRAGEIRRYIEKHGGKAGEIDAKRFEPMLAETADQPFSSPEWLFELKVDGYRALVEKKGTSVSIRYRRGTDATHVFPDLARAFQAIPGDYVLDGEIAVLDRDGKPQFRLLQQRAPLRRPADVARATIDLPATFYAFDLLAYEGLDVRPLPLTTRKEALAMLVPRAGVVRYIEPFEEHGLLVYEEVKRLRLEGIVAKRRDSPYRSGRSPAWKKIKLDRTAEFAVVGYTRRRGQKVGLGALDLAFFDGDRFVYAGRVGTGFRDGEARALEAILREHPRTEPPCDGVPKTAKDSIWTFPTFAVEVRYREWTNDGKLRDPVYVRRREDKKPEDCRRERIDASPPPPPPATKPLATVTNETKILFPEDGLTKGELVAYYRGISAWMLPWLRDRPVVLTRFPDGIHGKSFYQHDAPVFAPGWMRTARLFRDRAGRAIDAFLVEDEESLAYLANLGTIPIHMWASRTTSLGLADWCSLDLDPKGASFETVVKIARFLHDLCDEIGLPNFVKTSGQSGLHVLIPLGARCTHEQARGLGLVLARVTTEELPDEATIARAIADRGDRVYVDFGQNGYGRTLVAPYCVRPIAGARVSTPLTWDEVKPGLDPARFTVRTVPERARKQAKDPLDGLLDLVPDIPAALEKLQKRLQRLRKERP